MQALFKVNGGGMISLNVSDIRPVGDIITFPGGELPGSYRIEKIVPPTGAPKSNGNWFVVLERVPDYEAERQG